MEKIIDPNRRKSTTIVKRNYIGRFIVYTICLTTILPEVYHQGAHFYVWLYGTSFMILFPHLAYFLAKKAAIPQKMELNNMLIEGFNIGFFCTFISFSLWPIYSMLIPSIIYVGFYGGWRFYLKVIGFIIAGILVSGLLFGFNLDFDSGSISTYTSAIAIPIMVFALVINIQNDYKRSREKVRKSKEQLQELANKLSKYLSPQVYSQIFLGKKEVRLESYRKKLTVFFSDIVGFTELTDSMESEAVSALLNNYFNEMAKIALKHGGTIDKYMGDAIMIFFGDPESKGEKEDAVACVMMAIEMRERLTSLRQEWKRRGIAKGLHVRMGINTGYCTVGNFGSEDRLDYTIIGGQVNLANRLESNAPIDQILISESTYLLVRDKVYCEEKEEIFAKGIARPVQTYQVVGVIKEEESIISKSGNGFSIEVDFENAEQEQLEQVLQQLLRQTKKKKKDQYNKCLLIN